MWRTLVSLGVGLAMTVGVVGAAQIRNPEGSKDPIQPPQNAKYMQGKIVRVDPQTGMIVVRTLDGDKEVQREYMVNKTTKFWGPGQKTIEDGLGYKGFKEGTNVWYQMGTGNQANTISDLRFYNPALPPGGKQPPPKQ
jgi:hypothetical protein